MGLQRVNLPLRSNHPEPDPQGEAKEGRSTKGKPMPGSNDCSMAKPGTLNQVKIFEV